MQSEASLSKELQKTNYCPFLHSLEDTSDKKCTVKTQRRKCSQKNKNIRQQLCWWKIQRNKMQVKIKPRMYVHIDHHLDLWYKLTLTTV